MVLWHVNSVRYAYDIIKNNTASLRRIPTTNNGCTNSSYLFIGPNTTAETIIARLFKPLGKTHGVDVFMSRQQQQLGWHYPRRL